MTELGLADTNGILCQPWVRPERTSAGLGWDGLYVSSQAELPYRASFDAARTHLVILHLDGPVTVRRGHGRLSRSRQVPTGGLFLHPAGRDLTVELGGGNLRTVHAYLDDAALRDARGAPAEPVELAEELPGCRLLRAGRLPIAEVAMRCGFSHQEHLTRVMRARLGTTPAAVRRRAAR